MRKLLITVCLLTATGFLYSQDIHFSQYHNAFQQINPAETGNFFGQTRISYLYRNQWKALGEPFVTNYLSLEQNIYLGEAPLSFGINFLDDRSGSLRLHGNKAYLSVAYHPKYNDHYLHFALQYGGVYKQLDFTDATFPSQYNRGIGGFDPSLSSNEIQAYQPAFYGDLNLGLAWNRRFGDFIPKAGFALFHLNTPNESFYGEQNTIKPRNMVDLRLTYLLTRSTKITGLFFHTSQSKASELLSGVDIEHSLYKKSEQKQLAIMGGIRYRHGFNRNRDAGIIMAGARRNRITGMISYDVNISNLQVVTDNRGAIEFSVIYLVPLKISNINYIPCERY